MKTNKIDPYIFPNNISASGLSIYDPISKTDQNLWIPTQILEDLLNSQLKGLSLSGLPLRTRSKVLKENVCKALGYPVPKTFNKTQPRFPGQNFDTYVQKSNNLQIWNEEIEPSRRYAIIKINDKDVVTKIRVISGQELSLLDKTGTLTKKYQARLTNITHDAELVTPKDTKNVTSLGVENNKTVDPKYKPTDFPTKENLLSIDNVFNKLKGLIGKSFDDLGYDQERNRGAGLHNLVCRTIGYEAYLDNGRFPDILNQLLEIKLQTSPTIDLGLVNPDSQEILDIPQIENVKVRHCDVRYAVFYAETNGKMVKINNLFLTTGEGFFRRFPQFQGKVINAKIQIPLPSDFFI
jgi:hypothetical protein